MCLCRSQTWIENQQMGAFLSVSKGSEEPPVFLELHYNGSPDSTQAPLVLVGKGITFDRWTERSSLLPAQRISSCVFRLTSLLFVGSGGISLKPSSSMDAMRADMGGAATVCASIVTAAALKLPVNIIGEFYNMQHVFAPVSTVMS